MIRLECDYTEGGIPEIMDRLVETNLEQTPGYGMDYHCEKAREYIKKACAKEDADVHFLVGGTQTNATVISAMLRPHQGVISADTGHINGHETGAIEATGHKVMAFPAKDGKITSDQVLHVLKEHYEDPTREHVLQPAMVYLSWPTECGTLYSKEELMQIREICTKYDALLYLDGARMGYGLMSEACDCTLEELASIADIFYIGGTKVGAMFGEAVVICNPALKKDFRYFMKQRGGMLAKGRLLGIQFEVLFEDGKYFGIAKHADDMAMKLRKAFQDKGYEMFIDSYTNEQFVIMENEKLDQLAKEVSFLPWGPYDEKRSIARFVTSWATKEESIDSVIRVLDTL